MEETYSVKDIQQFLFDNGFFWDGIDNNKNGAMGSMIQANINGSNNTFLEVGEAYFRIYKEEYEIMYQDHDSYKTLLKDLSLEWMKYLYLKYPNYANGLNYYVKSKTERLNDYAARSIKSLQSEIDKIKKDVKEELKSLQEIRDMINSIKDNSNSNEGDFNR